MVSIKYHCGNKFTIPEITVIISTSLVRQHLEELLRKPQGNKGSVMLVDLYVIDILLMKQYTSGNTIIYLKGRM